MSGLTPDQVIEAKHALQGLAEMLRSYYMDLQQQGFTQEQALQLVIAYQRGLQGGATES